MSSIEHYLRLYESGRLSPPELRSELERLMVSSPTSRDAVLRYLQTMDAESRSGVSDNAVTTLRPLDDATRQRAPDAATQVRPCPAAEDTDEPLTRVNPEHATMSRADEGTRARPDEVVGDRRSAGRGNELRVGTRLRGRYVLETRIGHGAMGEVWRAKDLLSEEARAQNPYVAIKVLLHDIESHPGAFKLMHREAARTQKLAHPNIVTVYTLDRDDQSGRAFIAMELLEGQPLDKFVKADAAAKLTHEQRWRIVKGLAEGLAHAHHSGVVHSDFKPGNVFITGEGIPKILDFGIAQAVRQSGEVAEESEWRGFTESYAALEVLENREPSTADDVYALGLVVYEIFTGVHPFAGRNAQTAKAQALQPKPIKGIKRRDWRTLERALALHREQRFRDAGQFLKALQRRIHLQVALAVTAVALMATAGGMSYWNHLASLPTVPFERLSPDARAAIAQALSEGDSALSAVRDQGLIEASADAADRYADAYARHPRNPAAVRGLEAAAGYFIDWSKQLPDRQRAREELEKFQSKSEFYAGYAPLTRAIRELGGS